MANRFVVGSTTKPLSSPQRPPAKGVADPTTKHDYCPCGSSDIWVAVDNDEWTVTCRACGHTWTLSNTDLEELA